MPDKWVGSTEDRYARLELAGKRCDGNSRQCVHSATEAFRLMPAKLGVAIPGAKSVEKQSCSRHRRQFDDNEGYVVIGRRQLSSRSRNKPHPNTIFGTSRTADMPD